jgi:hypothetical protein
MKPRSPGRQAVTLVFLLASLSPLGACLPDDPPVQGRLLHADVGIGRVEFRDIDGQPWVQFEVRQSRPENGAGGRYAVHLVSWKDPTQHRLVLASRADRKEWPRMEDVTGALFYMTEERTDDTTRSPVGDLVRLSLTAGVLQTITDVSSYVPQLDGNERVVRFYYRKRAPGGTDLELHLRELSGNDRNLGPVTQQAQFVGYDRFYYITGEDSTLTRLTNIAAEPEKLRAGVSSFLLHPNERYAVLTVSEGGKQRALIRELSTGEERPLPVEQPGRILGLQGNVLCFAQPARGGQPAVLHYFDMVTGDHRTHSLPEEIPNVVSLVGRGPDSMLFDSTGRLTIFRPGTEPPFEVTPLRPAAPSFSTDDRFLIFLEPEPPPPPPAVTNTPTGSLRVQDAADWQGPSRLLSPRGASVPIQPVGFRLRHDDAMYPLFFWARYGLGTSDLYFANHETGAVVKVASAIGAVGIGGRHVLGVLRLTQDLSGDLVYRDLQGGQERVIEHGVTDMQVAGFAGVGDLVAFVVRERMTSSKRNGLWATMLEPLPPPPEAQARQVQVRPWQMIDDLGAAAAAARDDGADPGLR